jgi:Xaa-Pro aminopeptidase
VERKSYLDLFIENRIKLKLQNMKKLICLSLFVIGVWNANAQERWKYFTPSDFEKRRTALMEKIGDGVALFLSAELPESFTKFRQDNNFYYFTGVEIPDAALIIDGKSKKTVLLVPDEMDGDIKKEAWIKTGKEAAQLYKVNSVIPKKYLSSWLDEVAESGQPLYLIMSPEEVAGMSRDRSVRVRNARLNDPWDGRIPREANFANKLKERFPAVAIRNLTPLVDSMRWIKDEKEIAVLRECGKIGAHGFDEAMRVTRPGIYEYQVVAACDFVYQNEGAQNPAYYAIAASGERGLTWHYNANNQLLKDGEVILLDYAPDLNYYVTDITRTWPVSGQFSEEQLKFYNCLKEAHEKVIATMKPGVTVEDLEKVAKEVYIKHGLEKYWLNYIGHFVGMSVHDVGPYNKPFVPGVVFNVEPIIEDKEKKIHLRLEDTIVITATGAENLTSLTPTDPKAIYKLIREIGVGEKKAF